MSSNPKVGVRELRKELLRLLDSRWEVGRKKYSAAGSLYQLVEHRTTQQKFVLRLSNHNGCSRDSGLASRRKYPNLMSATTIGGVRNMGYMMQLLANTLDKIGLITDPVNPESGQNPSH